MLLVEFAIIIMINIILINSMIIKSNNMFYYKKLSNNNSSSSSMNTKNKLFTRNKNYSAFWSLVNYFDASEIGIKVPLYLDFDIDFDPYGFVNNINETEIFKKIKFQDGNTYQHMVAVLFI